MLADDDLTQPGLALADVARIGHRIDYVPTAASTNDLARDLARQGAPEGTVVVTDDQPAGRGRFRRAWIVPPRTSLMLSVVLRPPLAALPQMPVLAGLAVVAAIEEQTDLVAELKWPNDVLIGARKCCGILVESEIGTSDRALAVLGIGLNVNFDPRDVVGVPAGATSLLAALGQPVPRRPLLAALLRQLDDLYARARAGESLLPLWSARLSTLGRRVRFAAPDRCYEGLAIGVDADGRLLIREDDGGIVALAAGEVTSQG